MLVYDVDGDGLADVVTSWHCHHYGLVWHQQQRTARGEITWKQHVILPPKPDLSLTPCGSARCTGWTWQTSRAAEWGTL